MTGTRRPYDAVLLISFGGPEGPDDVMPFLRNVTRGRGVPEERLEAVASHYHEFGGVSPINAQNRALLTALEPELRAHGIDLPLYWGNRNWHPLLADEIARMRDDGIERALAFATSMFSSYSGCRQYLEDVDRARAELGAGAPVVDKIRVAYDHPGFIEAMAARVGAATAGLAGGPAPRTLFTAHSIPTSMADTSGYEAQLRDAARLVADRVERIGDWELVFQSRSGPPAVPWLEPDIVERIETLPTDRPLVVVPLGFVSDHMEVVYDLDTEARAAADARGLGMVRVPTVGTHPRFVAGIRELVQERLDPRAPRAGLGSLGIRPDRCPADCCPPPTRPGSGRPLGTSRLAP